MKWSKWPSGSLGTALRVAITGGVFLASGFAVVPDAAAQLRRASVNVQLEGVGAIAAHIRRSLPRHLARELAQNPVDGFPPGARLIVNVQTIFLGSGSGGGRFGGFGAPDALDGEALVVDGRGRVLLRKPVAGRSAPDTSVVNAVRNEPRRVEELVANFAYWVVRGLP